MEAAALRVCPGCESRMGRFFAKAVEVDYCQFCGGVWLDKGEVLEITGHPEQVAGSALTSSRCPDCQVGMNRGMLDGVPVVQCGQCAGTYFPPDALDQLAGRHVGLLAVPQSRKVELDFRCPGCGERFPVTNAVTTGRGLACAPCAPAVGDVPGVTMGPHPGAAMDFYDTHSLMQGSSSEVGSVYDNPVPDDPLPKAIATLTFVAKLLLFFV